ncbi:hypothetical protein KK083_02015 [Fulvivirgaceae bacterium PWU4]|uniref:Lipocalin-like domain-containing protein n=1 Tax=Chryseosolibacter histidini TaxID=2782349 RepID=A0AAP2GLA8_9BACT|nr:hypothetical protein [Chryseosolibacter histidini]MBT1695633.1 hypothetical protein [Chryseosolibacter histidini]
MKNIKTLLIISMASALISCEEDDAPSFKKIDFYGKWATTEIVRYKVSTGSCLPGITEHHEYNFYPDVVRWYSRDCADFESDVVMEYTYDGKNTIDVPIMRQQYKIIALGNGTLKLDISSRSGRFATFTLKQICKPIGASCQDSKISNEMTADICGRAGVANWVCQ